MTDLDDEVKFHLEMRIDQLMRRGHSRAEATRLAHERLGDVNDLRQYTDRLDSRIASRRRWRQWALELIADLRQGARQIRRAPGTSFAAILTIALGIGAITATAAAVHRLLVSPIPGDTGNRIVRVSRTNKDKTFSVTPTIPMFEAWSAAEGFEAAGFFTRRQVLLDTGAQAEMTDIGIMHPGVLEVFSVGAVAGRTFSDGEPRVAMVSLGWASRVFGGAAVALGRSVRIDGIAHTVIGVLPDRFVIPFAENKRVDVWTAPPADRKGVFPWMVARIRPGVSDSVIRAQLDAAIASMADARGQWFSKLSRPQDDLAPSTRESLWVLFGTMAVVLLTGCVNVANLLLARAQARQHEFLVRRALGAGRTRLVRQLLAESGLLAAIGWIFGLGLANLFLSIARAYRPPALAAVDRVSLDPQLLLASVVFSGISALLFGLAPALLASGRHLALDLRRQSLLAGPDRRARRWRSALVVAEVALSAMLLIGSGLLIRTLIEMRQAPLGFQADGLISVEMTLPAGRYSDAAARRAAFDDLLGRMRGVPGVTAATVATGAPPGFGVTFGAFEPEGQPASPSGRDVIGYNAVRPDYFQITGTPIVAGRALSNDGDSREVVVSAALARRVAPQGSAVGKRFRLGAESPWWRIAGVAGDVTVPRPGGLRGIVEVMYPAFTPSEGEGVIVLRTTGTMTGLQSALRSQVEALDPAIRVVAIRSAAELAAESQALPRFIGGVLSTSSLLAVVMSSVGLYGVIAYTVKRRWREMGIRLALGADARAVLTHVMASGLLLIVVGLLAGLTGAYLTTGALRGLLFAIKPFDIVTFAFAGTIVGVVAAVAVYIPARRAVGIDPSSVLREP
jgi:putative ABC transport system permease protein